MPLASYILSLCLHVAVILMIWLWPVGEPLINLEKPVLISLVDGEPGGDKTPSPILGHMGEPGEGELAPTPPAERAEVAATAREETMVVPDMAPDQDRSMMKEEPRKPEVKPIPKPAPEENVIPKKVEKKPEAKPEKKEEKVKEKPKDKPKEQVKEKEKPKEKPKDKPAKAKDSKDNKKETKKNETDAIQAALAQAKRKATSRAESGDRGSSVERALAEARKQAGGNRGGGGGEGGGPGGGGMHDVYLTQVMLAVRPNWGYASASRQNMQCTIHITVTSDGEVQECKVTRSSGNAQYDSSCVNAIKRTSSAGDFPPPPTPEFHEMDIVFTLSDLRGA